MPFRCASWQTRWGCRTRRSAATTARTASGRSSVCSGVRPSSCRSTCARSPTLRCHTALARRFCSAICCGFRPSSSPTTSTRGQSQLGWPKWAIVPEALSDERSSTSMVKRVKYYRGIKEDVYVPGFKPDSVDTGGAGSCATTRPSSLVRPPANEAHYHNPRQRRPARGTHVAALCKRDGIRVVLVPRNAATGTASFVRAHPDWFLNGKTVVPPRGGGRIEPHLVLRPRGERRRDDEPRGRCPRACPCTASSAAKHRCRRSGPRAGWTPGGGQDPRGSLDQDSARPRDKDGQPDSKASARLQDIVGHLEAIMRTESE